jgi:hypothetical protein
MKNAAGFEQAGYCFPAAKPFRFIKRLPYGGHRGVDMNVATLYATSLLQTLHAMFYFRFLLYSFRKSSRAIVIDGALGLGALISSLSPSLSTAQAVVGPKAAIFISP